MVVQKKKKAGPDKARAKPVKAPSAKKTKKKKMSGFSFNARGSKVPPFRSCPKSTSSNFCQIPAHVMDELGEMFEIEGEMQDIMDRCPRATYCEILSKLLPARCMSGWRVTKYLGSGAYGYVFGCRSTKTAQTGALKIQTVRRKKKHHNEIEAHKSFSKLSLSPKLLTHCTTLKYGRTFTFLVMSRVDTTLYKWLMVRRSKKMLDLLIIRLFDIIGHMLKKGVTHGDLHADNIGFVYRRACAPGRIQILDHGYATTKLSLTELEIVQFMRTLNRRYSPRSNSEAVRYLLKQCQKEAKSRYGLRISRSQTYLEERFGSLRKKLARQIRK